MRFYGIPSEDRVLEIVNGINSGEWVFEDVKGGNREILDASSVKERLKKIIGEVKSWKEQLTTLAKGTVFVFVHEPEDPKAFKIYDTSSLGCSTELTPPRWRVYIKELEGKV
ncbi:hypothetical protein BCF55_1711 [Hydrogenivirga caldilitoris]|uniref:Uncharacterized protein n=1 Tax=Hydrogenivirga caldilitoris TaxID=246264 RepID=A0A497XTJ6_9AQUI|nr:hypothetical protein [Hydrogenivirga caldilitoris]RLJ71409.1 hypothetical protein BCF55_1711 [Hydrogenivirga caldilitoris]